MIEFIRKRLNSVFVLLLLGILIASFAFFGIGDVVQVGQGDTVAKVGSKRVTLVDLQRSYETFINRESENTPELTAAQGIKANLDVAVLQRLMSQLLLVEAAEDLGLSASDVRSRSLIASQPAFQLAGKYDLATYQRALAQSGVTEETLLQDLGRQQVIEQIQNVLTGAAYVPDAVVEAQLAILLETREADAILMSSAPFEASVTEPEEDALETFFEARRNLYLAPETRSFDVVYLTTSAVADEINVSDEDLLQAYEYRKEEFERSATIDLQLVVFDSQADADTFATDAVNGAVFLELAEKTGASREDITLGTLTREEVDNLYGDDIAQALFALNAGDVSPVLDGPFGYQVFRVASKNSAEQTGFEDVKDTLEDEIAEQLALDQLLDIGNKFQDELAAGATLQEAAKSFGLDVIKYENVDDTGVTAAGTFAPEQPNLQPILPEIFSLEVDNELEVQRLGDTGGYYIALLREVTPAREKELSEVREAVVTAWKNAEQDRLALEAATALAEKVREGMDMQLLASEGDHQYLADLSFNKLQARQGSLANGDLAPLLFDMGEGDVDVARSGATAAYVIAKLKKVVPGDPSGSPQIAAELKNQLTTVVENELLQQFLAGRADEIERDVNERALQTFRRAYDPTF